VTSGMAERFMELGSVIQWFGSIGGKDAFLKVLRLRAIVEDEIGKKTRKSGRELVQTMIPLRGMAGWATSFRCAM
jgi:hypothetical protein